MSEDFDAIAREFATIPGENVICENCGRSHYLSKLSQRGAEQSLPKDAMVMSVYLECSCGERVEFPYEEEEHRGERNH